MTKESESNVAPIKLPFGGDVKEQGCDNIVNFHSLDRNVTDKKSYK